MAKNRFFLILISILLAISLVLVSAIFAFKFLNNKDKGSSESSSKALTTAEMKEQTVLVKDVTTNLASPGTFVKVSFAFEMDSKKAKADLENLLDSRVKGTIIRTLSDMTAEQVQGSKGQDNLTKTLEKLINDQIKEGKVRQVSITDIVVQ
ncbi:flagellar basal body-associated protein FliL [Paenibacillus larvae subsp. larvae]|uniref:Flagellar protein FliL n=4 Tax=Paenibacillus larvae TaxID=1464 RepID=V9W4J7_9BACL|nr:flagellar basal body-associated FliL family protein [Paenibacillus larvae]AHD05951.1 flagellar basal body-associated protein FliL [Paenibacillus larvae subsp. larvae DSM 25430]AQT83639.1 flagellar basal body protein FliL [Paenibacillus larvae subsp. pulvifaciens]AQZ48776.1 flagellar basal body protein FliL [Paenibacillus larvae subsp. pulvifaciens]ARF69923.1 flagellar basal body protein FliL [Paenibacillus larvae subsp. pulvifaciens]AVF26871.1 flagellar basal body-associated protein FliL [P